MIPDHVPDIKVPQIPRFAKRWKLPIFSRQALSKVCFGIAGCLSIFVTSLQGQEPSSVPELEFFEKRIRPVLVDRCYECHSVESGKAKGGLRVDSREALRRGGQQRGLLRHFGFA